MGTVAGIAGEIAMHRPPAVNALFAGHNLPRRKAALDQIREYIEYLDAQRGMGYTCSDICSSADGTRGVEDVRN